MKLSPFTLLFLQASLQYNQFVAKASSNIRGSTKHDHHHHRKLQQLQDLTTNFFTSTCNWSTTPPSYVNSSTGSDRSDYGATITQPYKSIAYAVSQRQPCQIIYIMGSGSGSGSGGGTIYQNNYFGQSYNHQNTIASMTGVNDLIITNYDENRPIIQFDGPGGFVGGSTSSPTTNVAISGLEIIGPNYDISYNDAASNRLTDRSYYKGRGVAIWSGHHIHISDMVVHGCPGSGIRVNKGDYVTITNNVVYDNTWWSPRAESAIVLAVSEPIDTEQTRTKMYITDNVVHDNVNKIPYYNPNYAWDYSPIGGLDCASYSACEAGEVDGCPWQCRYGKATQDYIIDGSGVYVTRNSDTYTSGWMELSGNTSYRNGINGLVVHRTYRAVVRQNVIYENGVVPRLDRAEEVVEDWHVGASGKSRQPYSGLTLNNAVDVKLWSNVVAARYEDDYAFVQEVDSGVPAPVIAGGNNKACRGVVDINPASFVRTESDLSICIPSTTTTTTTASPSASPTTLSPTPTPKYLEVYCGDQCHLIQWSYDMGPSYESTENAEQLCADACHARDCRAFSTQYDYGKNDGSRLCFFYKESAEPNPPKCASDPFNTDGCTYSTQEGRFFIRPDDLIAYNVLDYNPSL